MRLLLVKCRSEDGDTASCAPPLGLASLAAVVRRDLRWDVRIVDTYLVGEAEALRVARSFSPNVVGLGAITCEHRSLHRLARGMAQQLGRAVVVAGGAHPTVYPHQTLASGDVRRVVLGEGEEPLLEILRRVQGSESLDGTPGTATLDADGRIRVEPPNDPIEDLDTLPFPAWDLLDVDGYARRPGMSVGGRRRYMALSTSRGCPFGCTYCHNLHGKRHRTHSASYVTDMIRDLGHRHGVHDLDVFDDNFNLDAPRMAAILQPLAGQGVRLRFPNGLRGDRLDEAEVDLLHAAGCELICLAVESASPRIQARIHKDLDLDRVRATITSLARRRVFTTGFFMLGFPTESAAEMEQTVRFAVDSRLHTALFFTVIPFPGTVLGEQVGVRTEEVLDAPGTYFLEGRNLGEVSDRRFRRIKRAANLRFHASPRRIARIVRDVPGRESLWRGLVRLGRYGVAVRSG